MAKPQAADGGREEPELRTWEGTMMYFISKFSRMSLGLFCFQSLHSLFWDPGQDFVFPGSELLRNLPLPPMWWWGRGGYDALS